MSKTKKKIVKVWGGVGNQLFIYAFARLLSEKTNGVHLEIRTGFTNDFYKRSYRLDAFQTVLPAASYFESLYYACKRKLGGISSLFFPNTILHEEVENTLCSINELRVDEEATNYYVGYWQRLDFSHLRPTLLQELNFIVSETDTFVGYKQLIQQSENSVMLHLRRIQYSDLLGLDYYYKGIEYILSKTKDVTIYIYSDDIEWCKKNFQIESKHHFIENFDDELYELKLMSLCHHFVIANSTYSWWGAWLSENKNKIVVMPDGYTDVSMNGEVVHL